jgi:hypothetical protein
VNRFIKCATFGEIFRLRESAAPPEGRVLLRKSKIGFQYFEAFGRKPEYFKVCDIVNKLYSAKVLTPCFRCVIKVRHVWNNILFVHHYFVKTYLMNVGGNTMSTTLAKKETMSRKWYVLDAAGKPLGRTAAQAAVLLRGKHKPTYTPNVDCGDFVIIINASDAV